MSGSTEVIQGDAEGDIDDQLAEDEHDEAAHTDESPSEVTASANAVTASTSTSAPAPALQFTSLAQAEPFLFRREALNTANDNIQKVKDDKPRYVARILDALLSESYLEALIKIHEKGFRCTLFDPAQVKLSKHIGIVCTVISEWSIVRENVFDDVGLHDICSSPQDWADEKVRLMFTNLLRATKAGGNGMRRNAVQADGLGRGVQRRCTEAEFDTLTKQVKADRKARKARESAALRAQRDEDGETGDLETTVVADDADAKIKEAEEQVTAPAKKKKKEMSAAKSEGKARKSLKRKSRKHRESEDEEEHETWMLKMMRITRRKWLSKGTTASSRELLLRQSADFEQESEEDSEGVDAGDDSDDDYDPSEAQSQAESRG
ncbi:hypothetical protein LTR95_012031, partial [Oleoguttula sp. CCFEE 5521]